MHPTLSPLINYQFIICSPDHHEHKFDKRSPHHHLMIFAIFQDTQPLMGNLSHRNTIIIFFLSCKIKFLNTASCFFFQFNMSDYIRPILWEKLSLYWIDFRRREGIDCCGGGGMGGFLVVG